MNMQKELGRLDFGLAKIGLPLLSITKENHGMFFLVDSGASHNIIRKNVLEYFNSDTEENIVGECQFYGIDGVEHRTRSCFLSFELNGVEHNECFQVLEEGGALDFPIDEKTILSVHGIVGVEFLIKFKCVIDFSTYTLTQLA